MTEVQALENLINFWKEANFKDNFYIHEKDYEYMRNSFEITNKKDNKSDNVIHAELLPEQYIGNLSDAKIYTIMLNPGFSENDISSLKNPNFEECVKSTLYQEKMNDFPFYMLNPEFSNLSGPGWWRNKLSFLCETIKREKKLNEKEALSFLSKNICNLELFPYHSKRFSKGIDQIIELPSVKKLTDFVKFNLKSRATRGEILVLIIRKSKVWQNDILQITKPIRNIKFLPSDYAQCAPIFPRSYKKDSPFKEINSKIEKLLLE